MYFTTIRDLYAHIEPLLGDQADPAIIERLAVALWGNARVGDEFEIPDDIVSLYLELESVIEE